MMRQPRLLQGALAKLWWTAPEKPSACYLDRSAFCQLACLHIRASQGTPARHAYHGGRDDDAEQQQELRRALREMRDRNSGKDLRSQRHPHLPEAAAKTAMRDPLAMLLSATGIPLGISIRMNPEQGREGALVAEGSGTDEQAARHVPDEDGSAAGSLQQCSASEPEGPSEVQSSPAADMAARLAAVVNNLPEMLASAPSHDTWGTTTDSAAEIAQRIADMGGGGGDGGGGDEDDDPEEELSAAAGRYLNEQQLSQDVQFLDEIFSIFAQVPWLDEEDVDEANLRGVVSVGLLGALEEVGWDLRRTLTALWSGERDLDVLTGQKEQQQQQQQEGDVDHQERSIPVGSREYAAVEALLYHTRKMEEQYGAPPAAGVAAAVASLQTLQRTKGHSANDPQAQADQQKQPPAADSGEQGKH